MNGEAFVNLLTPSFAHQRPQQPQKMNYFRPTFNSPRPDGLPLGIVLVWTPNPTKTADKSASLDDVLIGHRNLDADGMELSTNHVVREGAFSFDYSREPREVKGLHCPVF